MRTILTTSIAITLFLTLNLSSALAQRSNPYQTEVRGLSTVYNFLNGKSSTIRVSFANRGGIKETVLLTQRPSFNPVTQKNGSRISAQGDGWYLLQGNKKVRHAWRSIDGVAATVVSGEKMTLYLIGSRGRAYQVIIPLSRLSPSKDKAVAQLRFTRRSFRRPCLQELQFAHGGDHAAREGGPRRLRIRPKRIRYYVRLLAIADAEFYSEFQQETSLQIRSLLNAAEAIYLSELGIRFDLVEESFFTDIGDQPLVSLNPATLLVAFRNYTLDNRELSSYDIGHLFTGKDLIGSAIGVAFSDTVCLNPQNSFSLSKREGSAVDWITLAHEIGHNFGASHDTPKSASIMSAMVSPSHSSFSPFSIQEIHNHIDNTFDNPDLSCLRSEDRVYLHRIPSRRKLFLNASFVFPHQTTGCTFNLFGSGNRRLLKSETLSSSRRVRKLAAIPVVTPGLLQIDQELSGGIRGRLNSAFLRGQFVCDDQIFRQTPIRRIQSYRLPRRLLRTIQQKLA